MDLERGSVEHLDGAREDRDAAVEELYDSEYAALLRLATLLVGDERRAELAVLDGYARLHARWRAEAEGADPADRLLGHVVGCTRRRWFRGGSGRSPWRAARPLPVIVLAPRADAGGALQAAEHEALLLALARLPRRQREAVVLRLHRDLDDDEVAAVLRTSPRRAAARAERPQLDRPARRGAPVTGGQHRWGGPLRAAMQARADAVDPVLDPARLRAHLRRSRARRRAGASLVAAAALVLAALTAGLVHDPRGGSGPAAAGAPWPGAAVERGAGRVPRRSRGSGLRRAAGSGPGSPP